MSSLICIILNPYTFTTPTVDIGIQAFIDSKSTKDTPFKLTAHSGHVGTLNWDISKQWVSSIACPACFGNV